MPSSKLRTLTALLCNRTLLKAVPLAPLGIVLACSSSGDETTGSGGSGGATSGVGGVASSVGGLASQSGGAAGSMGTGAAASSGGATSGAGGRPVIDGPRPPNDALGFYDIDASDAPRVIRNDLSGALSGMIQFAQSHTVNPSGNDADNHPSLVAERAALVLVTPQNQDVESLELEWSVDGEPRGKVQLASPNDIPRSDSVNGDGRPDVVYSKRAWSVVLPWDDVVPGLELTVRDTEGNEGKLAKSAIEFGAPAELVLKVMRLGMLTSPPVSDDHWMAIDPVRAASDYFETQPIAQLILANYDDVQLSRVMVRDGTIYTTASSTTGGAYDGDMRQDCAKSSYSGGVNNADLGIVSSAMSDETNPRTTAQVVIHHAQGMYSNGVQAHGLSGGAGIGTLYSSEGNELSHELGHNWGLGHYPGQNGSDYFWASHHHESGWGFSLRRYRMRSNLHWTRDGAQTVTNGVASSVTWNDGTYSFNNDAMSGGEVTSSVSRVTHHTGYSARISQQFFDRGMLSETSLTGYVKWNKATGKRETLTPAASVKKPTKIGVPVYTFWGGYDAGSKKGVLYPALRGSYGHVFSLPTPGAAGDACWVEVLLGDDSKLQVALPATRHDAGSVNKLHFNVAQTDAPKSAKLVCRSSGTITELDSLTVPAASGPQPAAVRVGKDAGFSAYQDTELATFEEILAPLEDGEVPELSSDQWDLLDKLYDRFDEGLSSVARDHAYRLVGLLDGVRSLDSWMTGHAEALDAKDSATLAELADMIRELGLAHDAAVLLPPGQEITLQGSCVAAETDRTLTVKPCDGSAEQQFVMDARGAIHPLTHLEQCITFGASNSAVSLGNCDLLKSSQSWTLRSDQTIRSAIAASQVFDNAGGTLYAYDAHGGSNQKWSGLTRVGSVLLATLSSYNLPRLALLSD